MTRDSIYSWNPFGDSMQGKISTQDKCVNALPVVSLIILAIVGIIIGVA